MKDYYKVLIDGMDDTLTVTGIVRGAAWVGAELSNGSFGIAMNTEGESVQRKFASLGGTDLRDFGIRHHPAVTSLYHPAFHHPDAYR